MSLQSLKAKEGRDNLEMWWKGWFQGHKCCSTSRPAFLIFSCRKDERAVHIVSIGPFSFSLSLFGFDNGNIESGLEPLEECGEEKYFLANYRSNSDQTLIYYFLLFRIHWLIFLCVSNLFSVKKGAPIPHIKLLTLNSICKTKHLFLSKSVHTIFIAAKKLIDFWFAFARNKLILDLSQRYQHLHRNRLPRQKNWFQGQLL